MGRNLDGKCPGNGITAPNASGRKKCLSCVDVCEGSFSGDQQLINGCKNTCYAGTADIYSGNDYLELIGKGQSDRDEYNDDVNAAREAEIELYLMIGGATLLAIILLVIIFRF